MTYTALVFARGGSKGVKDKNVRLVGGKPMIAHAIECGLESRLIDQVVVSTDSEIIADVACQHGAEVLMRPLDLAQDNTPELLAWRHAVEQLGIDDLFISVPATSPLRTSEDVDGAIGRFLLGGCDIVFGISPSHRNPYLNMVTINEDDQLIQLVMGGSDAARRQDAPPVFDVTTCIYVAKPSYVMSCERLIEGRVGFVMIPPERALDIDSEHDLLIADLLMSNRQPSNPR